MDNIHQEKSTGRLRFQLIKGKKILQMEWQKFYDGEPWLTWWEDVPLVDENGAVIREDITHD